MNDENNIGPEVQNALDERIDWIEAVVAAERKYGVRALQQAVDELDDEHAKSLLFMLLINYCEDRKTIEDLDARRRAAPDN